MAESKKKCNDLSLKMKYEVIVTSERKPGIPSRKLDNLFSCGKFQIHGILKNKKHYKDLYERNASDKMKHCRKRSRKSEYSEINETLYKWFQLATSGTFFQMARFSWRRL